MDPLAEMSSLPVPRYITGAERPRAHHDARCWYGHKSNGHRGEKEGVIKTGRGLEEARICLIGEVGLEEKKSMHLLATLLVLIQ